MVNLDDILYNLNIEVDFNLYKKRITLQQFIWPKKFLRWYSIIDFGLAKIFISLRVANFHILYKNMVEKSTFI